MNVEASGVAMCGMCGTVNTKRGFSSTLLKGRLCHNLRSDKYIQFRINILDEDCNLMRSVN